MVKTKYINGKFCLYIIYVLVILLLFIALFPSPAHAVCGFINRYWVGGTGTWTSSDTTHWSASSGGAGGASVPSGAFVVFFDASSGGGTVTLGYSPTTLFSITMGAFTGTFDASTFNLQFDGCSTGSFTPFNASGTGTRTINLGSGTWTVSRGPTGGTVGNVWDIATTTNLTLNANASTIKIIGASTATSTFVGGGMTYNNLWFARGTGTGANVVTGSNTFNDFKDNGSAAHSIKFTAGTTQTVSTFTVSGTSGNVITINGDSTATTATHALVKTGGGTIASDYLNIQHSVATPANTWYAGTNSTDNQATATAGSGWTFTDVPDTTAPVISSVIPSSIASTSAAISWTTDEVASSFVDLGFVSNSYSWSTPESDTSPRVASHLLTLNNLLACTVYHYRVRSTDASSNAATSTDSMFATSSCVASAPVTASTTTAITTASGGSVALLTDSIGSTLTVPASFSASDATFQIKQLDKTSVIASISVPSGYSALGSHIYDFSALSATSTSVSSFDSAITVGIAYNASDVSGMDESSLKIYRYDGSSWNQLSSCSVNTSTKTVSCTTTAFSTFGLFGSASVLASGGPGFILPIQYISPVTDAQAITGDGKISLSWTNPADSIFDHIVIYRKRGSIPSLYDGTKIFSGNTDKFIDTDILNNEIYYYAIYAVDSSNGVSSPIITKTMPQTITAAVISPTVSTSTLNKAQLQSTLSALILQLQAMILDKKSQGIAVSPQAEEFLNEILALNKKLPISFVFNHNLKWGDINEDIKTLQKVLNAHGFIIASIGPGSPGNETMIFGLRTKEALKRCQKEHNIPATGNLGPITRKHLNGLSL